MDRVFCNVNDLNIVFSEKGPVPGKSAELFDCDGNRLFTFWHSGWTEALIQEALTFANFAFRQGFEQGQKEKTLEIRRVLDF